VLPGTGHFPQLEAPQALADVVDATAVASGRATP
jgi:pimeloyl-ACP methyl ester carboxylesterase